MAQMMSHTVLSMPAMPRVATSSSSCGLPVGIAVGPKQLISTPLNPDMKSSPPTPATFATSSGCASSMAMQAKTAAQKAGSLRTISTPVATGTASNQGVMRNVPRNDSAYIPACVPPVWSSVSPAMTKTASAMTNDGTVVYNM